MLPNLSITLVEPEYPVNAGYVARIAKNFGVRKLYLVDPKVDLSVASIYAAHGADMLEQAERMNFRELRRAHDLLVATTAIRARRKGNVTRRTVRPAEAATYLRAAKSASIVLGRDTTGLKNEEIKVCDLVTSIDTGTNYSTLNVSHAAAILLHLASNANSSGTHPTSRTSRELFARNLYELAVSARFHNQKKEKMREVAKRVALASRVSEKEMLWMVGIFRRAKEAIQGEESRYKRSKT